jgi:purine-binding chemotaxis protein CheW
MDIAKIRKKLKELEVNGLQEKTKDREVNPTEDPGIPPDEKINGSSADSRPSPEAEDLTYEAGQPTEEDIDIVQGPGPAVREEPGELKAEEEKAKTPVTGTRTGPEQEEVVEILTFNLLNEEFAFRISHLEEILRYQRITKIPKVPKYVLGITSLRGKVIPVIDLKLKFSLTSEPSGIVKKGKILIIKGPKGPIGAAVDKVIGVIRLTKSEILPPPSHLSEAELKFIDGVAIIDKRFVSIINMEETVSLRTQ